MARRFLIGAALACAAHAQAQVVELPGEVRGIDRKVATSWQVDRPAVTGFVSGITLGLWPDRFGSARGEGVSAHPLLYSLSSF